MISTRHLNALLATATPHATRDGTRDARDGRVARFAGSGDGVTTTVRTSTGVFDVALWVDEGVLEHRCTCSSWRATAACRHTVAAALALGAHLSRWTAGAPRTPSGPAAPDDDARRLAVEERVLSARAEHLAVRLAEPPFLTVESPSGFAYRVHLRGGATGPHGCDCPDFEANRLHTCKHVERARRYLASARLPAAHRDAALRPRVHLRFGEVVAPRLFGGPARGAGSAAVRAAFDAAGRPVPAAVPEDDAALRDFLAGLGAWVEPEALAWLDRRLERRPRLPATPLAKLVGQLALQPYDYQWKGAAFLATTGRALLADEMGLGKTVQAILAAIALRRADDPVQHVTIVCPASLRGGWCDEIARWIGEPALLLDGPATERARVIASRPTWLVTHYEQVLRDHREHRAHPPDLLVLDEAQRAKGIGTRTARVLKSIDSRHVFALTGTPLENRLEEAYAIAQLVDQRLLPPLWQIDRDHFVRDEGGRRVVLYRNLDGLRSRLAPAFLRRRKEDVALELPPRLRSVSRLPMHAAVVATYEDAMAGVARIASKKVILPADLDRMRRLLVIARRCCNGPHMLGVEARDRDVPKLEELEHTLRDLCLGEGRKAIVFSEWTDMTDRVEALCARLHLPAVHLHGGVPVPRRPALIRKFTDHEGPAVFISTDAGGVGLNLQAADVVVNLDLPWNPARLEQRVARAHRIGSKRPVQVLLLVTKDSIEERILRLHETKRNVLENVWAKGGEDVIAAPGGSGAFRDMVAALVQPLPGTSDAPSSAEDTVDGPLGSTADPPEASGALLAPLPLAARSASVTPDPGPASPVAAVDPAAPGPASPVAAVDPAALASALAAVAPALPPEHRKSLAAVLHALAAALESGTRSDPVTP